MPRRGSRVRVPSRALYAQIAQSVEQRTENPRVAGSIPALGIASNFIRPIGQAVKTPPFHGGNRSSILLWVIARNSISGCGSVWLERLIWVQEAAGSSPVTPIYFLSRRK